MTAERSPRIWLHPPEYWAATADMSPEEAEQFMNKILSLAENHEFETLRKYDFISIDDGGDDSP